MIKNEFTFSINPQDIRNIVNAWKKTDDSNLHAGFTGKLTWSDIDFLMSEILIPIYEQETGILIDV